MCELVKTFASRQGVLVLAGLLFLAYTYARVRTGRETRDFFTFCADVSKQGVQQMFGGVLMAALGILLASHSTQDALSWYAAEYPFEIVLTTTLTGPLKRCSTRCAPNAFPMGAEAFRNFGCYRDSFGTFRWDWYRWQLFQAVFLIGVPARLMSVATILGVVHMGDANPISSIARLWDASPLDCFERSLIILYITPVVGDVIQFIVIDAIQKFASPHHTPSQPSEYKPPTLLPPSSLV